jgi:hypothetical protein
VKEELPNVLSSVSWNSLAPWNFAGPQSAESARADTEIELRDPVIGHGGRFGYDGGRTQTCAVGTISMASIHPNIYLRAESHLSKCSTGQNAGGFALVDSQSERSATARA